MLAVLLYNENRERIVAWVIHRNLEQLQRSWTSAGWQVADQVKFDHPWPAATKQVVYCGTHPKDDRMGW